MYGLYSINIFISAPEIKIKDKNNKVLCLWVFVFFLIWGENPPKKTRQLLIFPPKLYCLNNQTKLPPELWSAVREVQLDRALLHQSYKRLHYKQLWGKTNKKQKNNLFFVCLKKTTHFIVVLFYSAVHNYITPFTNVQQGNNKQNKKKIRTITPASVFSFVWEERTPPSLWSRTKHNATSDLYREARNETRRSFLSSGQWNKQNKQIEEGRKIKIMFKLS